jgi:molybdate transport system ATP-binding protein
VVLLDDATLARPGGGAILRNLTWTLCEGETWAMVGPVGSGKTMLAEALLGRCHLESGVLTWPLLDRLRAAGRTIAWPAEVIHRVSFKEESWLFSYSRHYYQQRFNFVEERDDLTLDAFLRAGATASEASLAAAAERLGVAHLRSLSLIKLSNGQIRRARIARALMARPELLILDEPFMGLDAAGRGEVAVLLGDLIRTGLRVLLITRPDLIPDWATHVLELDHLSIRRQGPHRTSDAWRGAAGDPPAARPRLPAKLDVNESSNRPLVVELHDVTVQYGDRAILQNVSWTVRRGERWALLGPNGAGKSTLLSLLCGDHPQAYSNDVRLFGRRRGSGESIWDVKRSIGLTSPELHLYFSEPLSAAETAATGFFDVLARRPTTPDQEVRVRQLFESFGVADLAARPFARLSTGEQRLVLLIRALVKDPPLLILDEPFQGLDARLIDLMRTWLDTQLHPEQTLIFVSHHGQEIPPSVNRRLLLREGRVVEAI